MNRHLLFLIIAAIAALSKPGNHPAFAQATASVDRECGPAEKFGTNSYPAINLVGASDATANSAALDDSNNTFMLQQGIRKFKHGSDEDYFRLSQPVGRLEVLFADNNANGKKCATWCTASIINDSYILTAGHCIWTAEHSDPLALKIRLGFVEKGDLGIVYDLDPHPVEIYGLAGSAVKYDQSVFRDSLDYAILKLLPGQPRPTILWSGLQIDNPPKHLTFNSLYIPSYPEAYPLHETVDGQLTAAFRPDPGGQDGRIYYKWVSTLGGMSGAPIFLSGGTFEFLGIHTMSTASGADDAEASGVSVQTMLARSPILHSLTKPNRPKPPTLPVDLRGHCIYLGAWPPPPDITEDKMAAEAPSSSAPFGFSVLKWIRDGNPIASVTLAAKFDVNVRDECPSPTNSSSPVLATIKERVRVKMSGIEAIKFPKEKRQAPGDTAYQEVTRYYGFVDTVIKQK